MRNHDRNVFIYRGGNECSFSFSCVKGKSVPPPPREILYGALAIEYFFEHYLLNISRDLTPFLLGVIMHLNQLQ